MHPSARNGFRIYRCRQELLVAIRQQHDSYFIGNVDNQSGRACANLFQLIDQEEKQKTRI